MLSGAIVLCSSFKRFFFCAVVKIPTPIFFVRYKLQPTLAPEFFFRFSISIIPVTANPKTGSGQSILCPPASGIFACAHALRAPSKTSLAYLDSTLSIGQPRIAIAIIGVPPIA